MAQTTPRTKAGRRHHDARHLPEYCSEPCELRQDILAIEDEAREPLRSGGPLVSETLQDLINSGMAWRLEGAIGRAASEAIENGECLLGLVGRFDFYGQYIPSRFEVEPGTKGSPEYQEAMQRLNEDLDELAAGLYTEED